MEVNKLWKGNDINKYYIITRDKETNEWKFFKEIVGHTVLWKDEPSRYGMTKSKAIEVLNIVKSLTNEDVKPEDNNENTKPTEPTENKPTEPTTPTEPSGEDSGTTTPTEPSESNTDPSTNTSGETSTGENNNGETPSEGNTEPNNAEPTSPVEEPTTPVDPVPTEEPQYKIITISSVTYNSTEVAIFDDDDYNKLKSTLVYINTTYSNNKVHVVTVENDAGKSIFYFYLEEELTWFLELKTNIDYSLVSNVTTLDNIRELL